MEKNTVAILVEYSIAGLIFAVLMRAAGLF
jgi:hypothetical protein